MVQIFSKPGFRFLFLIALYSAATSATAIELRVGKGNFNNQFSLSNALRTDYDLAITNYSIASQHEPLFDSEYFLIYDLTVFDSDYVNKYTDFFGSVAGTTLNTFNNHVETAYRFYGVDLNMGLGYDLVKSDRGFFGVGVSGGISAPVIATRNPGTQDLSNFNLLLNVLDTTKTSVQTYKIGPVVSAGYRHDSGVNLTVSYAYNYQTGQIKNDYFLSELNVKGYYTMFDISISYEPSTYVPKGVYFVIGYSRKNWNYDSASVNVAGLTAVIPSVFDTEFNVSNSYLGVGYHF
jgi:hypothetical protein